MNGKIRVSIVATSLKGSSISDSRPVLNVVNGSNGNKNIFTENLFSKSNVEQNVINSIDGANALKLDESFEIKSDEEQNALIDSFENKEENQIKMDPSNQINAISEIPTGVSIESASYMENNPEMKLENTNKIYGDYFKENTQEENTPKLFAEDHSQENLESKDNITDTNSTELFDQDNDEDAVSYTHLRAHET